MDTVLAVMTSSPYRNSVAQFAASYARCIDGRVRVLSPAQSAGDGGNGASHKSSDEDRLDTLQLEAEEEVERFSREDALPVEGQWVLGDPVKECVGAIAECDFGVVGKTLRGKLPPAQGLGRQVAQLKQVCTKPLVIVSQEVRPIRKALFVSTDHPESGHALALARPLSHAGAEIVIFATTPASGRAELRGAASAYLQDHAIPHRTVESDCGDCEAHGAGAGPVEQVLRLVRQEAVDFVLMGGTRRGFVGRMLWPEMAYEVAWNVQVPLLIWY